MASQLNLDYARVLQKASGEVIRKTNQHNKLLERHITHHPSSDELTTFIKRMSNYPNNERLAIFMSMTGRASSDSDIGKMYWILATKGRELMGVWQTTNLYLTNHGELAVDQGYSVDGRFPSPSVDKAKDVDFIADIFDVDDLKQAIATLRRFDSWLTRMNDELNDLWREEHSSLLGKLLAALSQK